MGRWRAVLPLVVVALGGVIPARASTHPLTPRQVWIGLYMDEGGRTGEIRAIMVRSTSSMDGASISGPMRCRGEACVARRGTISISPCIGFGGSPLCGSIRFRRHKRHFPWRDATCTSATDAPRTDTHMVARCTLSPSEHAELDLIRVRPR